MDTDWQVRDEQRLELLVAYLCLAMRTKRNCSRKELFTALWIPEDNGVFDRVLKLAQSRGLVARDGRGYYVATEKAEPLPVLGSAEPRIALRANA
ncbi:MAG TPA: hypothetical protein VHY83_04885 [Solirubrobacteraceae bacterium]|jgi:hypothetical protein|nr:hypothetical protein [Solirubrobacteraceae bacterium]